ncbi:putative O-methyltransferase YrrM [Actinokineospora baliensis]|uniref:O-methyltransferase n=1 Tax=Actinokineospora baliensis TaxID=547056 RepID=UPI00195D4926|nr:O-methyltransferase [Actinokineospora baliensis]MBM7771681.1 putative O-methyltransferase YrrM [Actinokineospora baliensis]
MSPTTSPDSYIRSRLGSRDAVLDGVLRDALLEQRLPAIQVDDNGARVLQLLTMLHRPRLVVEVGTLFGYSAIHIARGLPPGGKLITIDVDAESTALAERYLREAGVADRVEVVTADATTYLAGLEPDSVDMVFIDADKKSYPQYLKACFPLLRPGGLLVADDVAPGGDFSGESQPGVDPDREAAAIDTYVRAVGRGARLFSAFVGTGHGLLVSYKDWDRA